MRLSQKQRVLRALEAAGPKGITQVDLLSPPDGPAILRLGARIWDLRQEGYVIRSISSRTVERYVLVASPSSAGSDPPEPDRGVVGNAQESLLSWAS